MTYDEMQAIASALRDLTRIDNDVHMKNLGVGSLSIHRGDSRGEYLGRLETNSENVWVFQPRGWNAG